MKRLLILLLALSSLSTFAQRSGHLYLGFTPVSGNVVYYDGTNWVALAPGTTSQYLRGGTSPTWSQIVLSTGVSGTLPGANGGTGQSSYVIGDLLYASSTTSLSKRNIGSSGDVLTVSGGLPVWSNSITSTQYKLSALNTAPASATDTGTTGEIRVTATFIYVCVASNTWVRSPLTSW